MSGLSDRDQRLVETIGRSTSTMSSLIDDLLTYTLSQLGQEMSLDPSPADLGEIATDIVREADTAHPRREIRLRRRGDLKGEWDQGRIRQCVSNLVNNAIQHAPEDSAITVTVSGELATDEVVVSVHNLGTPIPEDQRELIFQPFRRASSLGRGNHSGRMGLGLYIARRMAEAHGGTVHVESSAGQGTTFSVRLSRSPQATSGA